MCVDSRSVTFCPMHTQVPISELDIVFITYEQLQKDKMRKSPLRDYGFWRIILDEAQMVGDLSSVAAEVAGELFRFQAWVVTGERACESGACATAVQGPCQHVKGSCYVSSPASAQQPDCPMMMRIGSDKLHAPSLWPCRHPHQQDPERAQRSHQLPGLQTLLPTLLLGAQPARPVRGAHCCWPGCNAVRVACLLTGST